MGTMRLRTYIKTTCTLIYGNVSKKFTPNGTINSRDLNMNENFSYFNSLPYSMYEQGESWYEVVSSALIITNCTRTTLERAANVTITINLDKKDPKQLMKYGMTQCYRPSLKMSDFLPAFFTIDIADDQYYSQMTTVYEQLPAKLEQTQLNVCKRGGTEQKPE